MPDYKKLALALETEKEKETPHQRAAREFQVRAAKAETCVDKPIRRELDRLAAAVVGKSFGIIPRYSISRTLPFSNPARGWQVSTEVRENGRRNFCIDVFLSFNKETDKFFLSVVFPYHPGDKTPTKESELAKAFANAISKIEADLLQWC